GFVAGRFLPFRFRFFQSARLLSHAASARARRRAQNDPVAASVGSLLSPRDTMGAMFFVPACCRARERRSRRPHRPVIVSKFGWTNTFAVAAAGLLARAGATYSA